MIGFAGIPIIRRSGSSVALEGFGQRGYPLEEVELLLDVDAGPNARDPSFGYTPLHDAALGDDAGIVQVLLDTGADPGARVARGIHTGYGTGYRPD